MRKNILFLVLCALIGLASWAHSTLVIDTSFGNPGRTILATDIDGAVAGAETTVATYILNAGQIKIGETFRIEAAGEFNNTSGAAAVCTVRLKRNAVTQGAPQVANCAVNCNEAWSTSKDWRIYATDTEVAESLGWQTTGNGTWSWTATGGTASPLTTTFSTQGTWTVTFQTTGAGSTCTNRHIRFVEN